VFAPHDIRLFDELTATGGDRATELIPAATRAALSDVALRATLHAYLDADLNVPAAARAMSLHPNSVRYRLRRIGELTGRDPLKITDLLELITASRLLDRNNTSQTAHHAGPRTPSATSSGSGRRS
jgi:sugar diacid utilization regulator